eukprot:6055507-Amphidinium_carterae.1
MSKKRLAQLPVECSRALLLPPPSVHLQFSAAPMERVPLGSHLADSAAKESMQSQTDDRKLMWLFCSKNFHRWDINLGGAHQSTSPTKGPNAYTLIMF